MRKFYLQLLTIVAVCCFAMPVEVFANPGVASASQDSICVVDNTTLILTGYSGTIQWQSHNGAMWINETGTGFDTDNYTVTPGVSTDYRALVTDSTGSLDSSNVVSIFVNIVPVPTAAAVSRCGLGPITLTATGIGLQTWYADSIDDNPLHEGDTFTTSITETTTYYVSTVDTNSSGASGNNPPTLLGGTFGATNGSTENAFNVINHSNDDIIITTINWEWDAGTGTIAVVTNPTGGNNANATSGAGWVTHETFPNITANGPNTGTPTTFTTPLLIPGGATVGIGFDVVSGTMTNSYQTGNGTPWVSPEFTDGVLTITEGQAGGPPGGGLGTFSPRNFWGTIEYQLAQVACESERVPVVASITAPPAVNINAYPSKDICGADTVSLAPSSVNTGYSYTWTANPSIDTIIGDSAVVWAQMTGTYYVFADDGTCASLDSVEIDVGVPTVAGLATVATDSICLGHTIPLNLNGSTGVIHWQYNNGSGWITPFDSVSMTSQYPVSPTGNTDYRAYLTSGGCPNDTSNTLSLTTITVSHPSSHAVEVCGPGTHMIASNAVGTVYWYATANSNVILATGSATAISVTADTTVYIAHGNGAAFNIGKPSDTPGGLAQSQDIGYGMGFDVAHTSTINRVTVYPFSSGDVEIVLRQGQGGQILESTTVSVMSGGNPTDIDLGWIVFPGAGYRMEMGANTTASLIRNTSGAAYPMTSPSSNAIAITGFLNPTLNTSPNYYYFYNWVVNDGCVSQNSPVTITVHPLPTPVISAAGSILTSTPAISYQWYLDSVAISGATMQSYTATVNGLYQVVVTDQNGCTNISVGFPLSVGVEEYAAGSVQLFPNPVNDNLQVQYELNYASTVLVRVYNSLGELVSATETLELSGVGRIQLEMEELSPGMYFVQLGINEQQNTYKILKE